MLFYVLHVIIIQITQEGGLNMPYKSPWHSIKANVHHNNSNCNTGNNIEKENLRTGTGGKPLCAECADLNKRGK